MEKRSKVRSNKWDFDTLFKKALKEYPPEIKFGPLIRYDKVQERYHTQNLYKFCDGLGLHYMGTYEEVLMRNIHDAIYIILRGAALYCTSLRTSQIRKETVQARFESRLAPEYISPENRYTDEDRRLVKLYFKQTKAVQAAQKKIQKAKSKKK
jgi:hypothetical protein